MANSRNLNSATPIKCLDLDDISGHLKLEGWLYDVVIFSALINEEAPFISNLGEEAPFYWLFQVGGTILLGKFGRRMMEFFYL